MNKTYISHPKRETIKEVWCQAQPPSKDASPAVRGDQTPYNPSPDLKKKQTPSPKQK